MIEVVMRREGVDYRAVVSLREPVEMAGTRFLIDAQRGKRNRQWAYFPDLDLVRPISGRDQDDPFLGSDITYADLAGGAHLDDLVHELIGQEVVDGEPCYLMEGVPRHRTSYGKLRGWVRKKDFVTVRAVFYDDAGKALKEARLGDIREVGGGLLAHRIEMRSLTDDSETLLLLSDVKVNQGLDPDMFTEEALRNKR
jgi:outer membrane lipoprotein-sorting protein